MAGPVTSAQLSTLQNMIHEAYIYTGCTLPAVNTPVALTAGVPAGGTSIGTTSGPASWDYKTTMKGAKIEQSLGDVAPRVEAEEVSLKFKAAEETFTNLQLAMPTAATTTTAGATSVPGTQMYNIGGQLIPNKTCVCLVSLIGSFTYMATAYNLYEWFMIYNAVNVEGTKLDYARGETRMIEITLKGWHLPTRDVGDQLIQGGLQTVPA